MIDYSAMSGLSKYWGYLLLLILITAWWTTQIGPKVLSIVAVVVVGYFLLHAPVWCCAVNRDGTLCRRNAKGLLVGCSLRQHKWQKLKLMILTRNWPSIRQSLFSNAGATLGTVGLILTIVSTAVGIVKEVI